MKKVKNLLTTLNFEIHNSLIQQPSGRPLKTMERLCVDAMMYVERECNRSGKINYFSITIDLKKVELN